MPFAAMMPLMAKALGGAALGALANPKDRKKGALMGFGLGVAAPMIGGMMGAGAKGVGTLAQGGITNAAPLAEGAGLLSKANNAAAASFGKIGEVLTGEGMKEAAKDAAVQSVPVALASSMQQQQPMGPSRSLAMNTGSAGPAVDLYQQAAINRQQRMKRQGPGRRLS